MWFLFYNSVLLILRGVFPLYEIVARLRGTPAQELRERLGAFSPPPIQGPWIQAASVGETAVASALIDALRAGEGPFPLYLTTTTRTGQAIARRFSSDTIRTGFFPADFPSAIGRFLDAARPTALILVETELWPNLLRLAARRKIPVVIINGRISDRAEPRYRFARPLLEEPLHAVTLACVQSRLDADRFTSLGVPAERIRVTGNIKFAGSAGARDPAPLLDELRVAPDAEVWLAGSTAEGEEEAVLAAWRGLPRADSPRRVMILAPRRPERFDEVAALIEKTGLAWRRRSRPAANGTAEVILLDSLGELSPLYRRASVAFVGGSLAPIGGHNLLEPAACGVAPIFGPYDANVREVARLLLGAGGAFQVASAQELAGLFSRLAAQPELRKESGARALAVVRDNAHAMETTVREIAPILRAAAGAS